MVEVHVVDIISSFGILIGQSLGLVCIFVVEVQLIDVPIVAMVGLMRRCQDRRGRLRQQQARLLFVSQLLLRGPLGVRLRSRRSLGLRPFGIPLVRRLLVRRLLELKLILMSPAKPHLMVPLSLLHTIGAFDTASRAGGGDTRSSPPSRSSVAGASRTSSPLFFRSRSSMSRSSRSLGSMSSLCGASRGTSGRRNSRSSIFLSHIFRSSPTCGRWYLPGESTDLNDGVLDSEPWAPRGLSGLSWCCPPPFPSLSLSLSCLNVATPPLKG